MAKIVIVYDSLRGNTQKIVDALSEMLSAGGHQVEAFKPKDVDMAAIEAADMLLLGGPTYHKDLINTMKQVLFKLEKAGLKDKAGAAFASYGWSGESLEIVEDTMKNLYGMKMVAEGVKIKQTPVVAKVKKDLDGFVAALLAAL